MESLSESNLDPAKARQQIYQAAVAGFRRLGYPTTSLADIAAEAGVPLADVQRCFSSKEAIALALVQAKIDAIATQIDSLAAGTMADRFSQALSFAVQIMSQDPEAVAAGFAHAMVDGAEFDLVSAPSAQRLIAALERLVLESDDTLREDHARDMGAALYATLMMILLFWCYDRSPGRVATKNLLELMQDLFARLRPLYFLPMAPQAIARLASIVQPLSQSPSVGAAAQEDARDSQHQDLDIH